MTRTKAFYVIVMIIFIALGLLIMVVGSKLGADAMVMEMVGSEVMLVGVTIYIGTFVKHKKKDKDDKK